jgi:hypothetical protein
MRTPTKSIVTEADETAAPFAILWIFGVLAWLAGVIAWVFYFRGYA